MKKRTMIKSLFAAALLALAPAARADTETKVNFSIFVPPTHPIYAKMILPWAKQVEQVTEGRVIINVLPKPLGGAPQHFDLARDGVAGAVFTIHGYTPGRFVLTQMAELPFSGDSAEAISVAYWKVHEKYFAAADEHDGVKLLGLFVHGPGTIFIDKGPINTVSDLNGIKFRVGGGMVNNISDALGMTSVLKSAPESYELLSNGVVDGILFPISSIESYRLEPFVPYALEVSGGIYNTSFMLGMNEAMFNGLSEQDQMAIEEISGEAFARLAGSVWDADTILASERYLAQGGIIDQASDTLLAEFRERLNSIEDGWVVEATALGVDGKAALAEFRELITSYPVQK